MISQSRYFVGGVLIGVVLTVCAALFVGPNVNVTSSNNINNSGRYELTSRQTDAGTEYAVLDSETGKVRVLHQDGTWEDFESGVTDTDQQPTDESGAE